ncbi:MAG: FAD-dependent oxidoreductase [Planctomycetes bacterium]|nr:FAD-dependent oxidoreductase [Planctomycetota bacterium]
MRLIIVGGVAGGASCAARARRLSETAEIVIFERGDHVSFANCGLPYYIGGDITERNRLLVQTAEGLRRRFNIDVRTRTEVLEIDRKTRHVVVRAADGAEHREPYDRLLLAPGADPLRPPIPGIADPRILTLRNLQDTDRIKNLVDAGARRALVVGGGYVGLEMVEALRHRGLEVTIVEMADQIMPPLDAEMAELLLRELKGNAVTVHLGNAVKSFAAAPTGVTATLADGTTAEADLVLVGIGVRPEVRLAKEAGLELGSTGGIKVDDHMRTSDPDIFAAGDAVEVTDLVTEQPALVPLAGPANRQGRIAADNLCGRDSSYKGTQGTAIVKLFSLAAGMTGANEKTLRRTKRKFEKVYLHPDSHAGYYPGGAPIAMKVLFDPDDGRLLGAQAVGHDGIDKRIDVLATALRAGMTVYDLEELELCYAPPFGSAKDPVNMAGFIAANVLCGGNRLVQPETVAARSEPEALVLDVRSREEYDTGHVENAMLIPVDELRDRLDELPRDKVIHAYCKVGLRAYLAQRILSENGFDARNLTGGFTTYAAVKAVLDRGNESR